MRMRLVEQLNGVLATRDTPRGLVVTVADSSFSGSELRGGVASRIGRLAAILAPYSDIQIVVEGSSDSAGNDSQATQARRECAAGVGGERTAGQPGRGSRAGRHAAAGFQLERRRAREQNRRVEIVISGDSIGTLPFWDRTYSLMTRRP